MAAPLGSRVRWTVGPAVLVGVAAMIRYPGGTSLDATTAGYSLSQNFLSDLGMTVAYDGQSNRLGAGLFVVSLLLLVVGLGSGIMTLVRLYGTAPASRRWARLAGLCGLLACVAFTGVAVTPENQVMPIHLAFTLWAWRIVPIGSGMMAVAAFRSSAVPRVVALVWVLMTLLLAAYAALLAWGPSLGSEAGLVVQVVAQKAAALVVIVGLLYIMRGSAR